MTDMDGNILFMGTPEFSVPILNALCESGFRVVGVVTQPDKPTGRRRVLTAPPVKQAAQEWGIPVLQPERVRRKEALEAISDLRPDAIVTAAYGQILPQALLEIPRVGSLNVHASLLPRWRGAAPIQRAIMAGDAKTGVSIMEMVAKLDAGPVYGMEEVDILPDDDFGSLHDRLSEVGASLLVRLLPEYLRGQLPGVQQSEEGLTYAERITRDDEWIAWDSSREFVHNHVRALNPWPGASTLLDGMPVKIWKVTLTSFHGELPKGPGRVVRDGKEILVACGDGWISLDEVQPAGKRKMSALDWFRGLKTDSVVFASGEVGAST